MATLAFVAVCNRILEAGRERVHWLAVRYPEELQWGILLRRYKRFLADVRLDDGREVTVHVPNPGRMTACSSPQSRCLVSPASSPARRLAWTLEQVVADGVPVGVNTARANRVAEEALASDLARFDGLAAPFELRREVRLGRRSRIDLLLSDRRGVFWLEVKNVTWVENGVALFPDAVTTRGTRHLGELTMRVVEGERAGLLYVVQRGDATRLRAAGEVDPDYATALRRAAAAGVELRAVQVAVAPAGLWPVAVLPVEP